MKQLIILTAALLAASAACAQIAIDQNRALAGNVTPGDAPGFPITLSAPGSYKLTGNLTVPAGVKGIAVTASGVTLDLNGHTIAGPSTCARNETTRAVTCSYQSELSIGIDAQAVAGIEVRNGTISGFGGTGLVPGQLGRFDNLRLTQNYRGAFFASANAPHAGSRFSNSLFDTNQTLGLSLNMGLVVNSRAIHNGGTGFFGTAQLLVADSQALGNGGFGLWATAVRGTQAADNGNNVGYVTSMGGNLNGSTPY